MAVDRRDIDGGDDIRRVAPRGESLAAERVRASKPASPTSREHGRPDKPPLWRRAAHRAFGLFLWCGALAMTSAGALMIATLGVVAEIPDLETVSASPSRPSVVYLDAQGREIARRGPVVAPPIEIEDLPPYLIDAVLAVEDRRFYDHPGLDPIGLMRAAFANVRAGRVVQGGSTITQQLAKNLFLDNQRTVSRKFQEAVLALWLETRYSKSEILEMYLNNVYFGAGAWGIEAAAQRYFGRSAADVSLAEAAILAGLLKAPSRYSPTNDSTRAADRAMVVLDLMVETGRITQAERDAALNEPVAVRLSADPGLAGHYIDWIAPFARDFQTAGESAIIVETTLDLDMQAAAEHAAAELINEEARARGAQEVALIAMEGDGAVRAMVGGRDYAASQFNRATQARRQPGSAFKAFVYAAAFEAGLAPWDVRTDAPISLGDWSPANYDQEFAGDMTLRDAFARSINTVAVRVAEEVGRDRVARLARRMGMRSDIEPTRSMALGSHEVTLEELTAAYAPFANGGYAVEPYGILRIRRINGEIVWEREAPEFERVLSDRARRLMNDMLASVVEGGTGRAAHLPDREAGGKTGTTNDFRDAWFIGYVPGFAAGVWIGADDFAPMDRLTGGALPARVWREFMITALDGAPIRPLDRPARTRAVATREPPPAPPVRRPSPERAAPPPSEPEASDEGGVETMTEPRELDRDALDALLDALLEPQSSTN